MLACITPSAPSPDTRINVIEAMRRSGLLALASGGICVDLGDSTCYSGSGQTLTDLLGSGNLNLGTTSGSEGSDPAFNGSAGALSKNERLTFGGDDWCTLAVSNPAGVNAMHKDNALFTLLGAVKLTNSTQRALAGTASGPGQRGFRWNIGGGAAVQRLFIYNGSGTAALDQTTTAGIGFGAWKFAGVSVDEAAGAGGLRFYTDGVQESYTATFSSPSSSNASAVLDLGSSATGFPMKNGDEIAFFALLFGVAATAEQFDRVFTILRGRFFA